MKAAIGPCGFGAHGVSVSISSYLLTYRESQWSSKELLIIRANSGNQNQLSASSPVFFPSYLGTDFVPWVSFSGGYPAGSPTDWRMDCMGLGVH